MSAVAITYAPTVHSVLARVYGPMRHAAKLLARDAGATPRAAENWLAGRCAPNGENLINLMASCDEIAKAIDALVEGAKCSRSS